MKKVAIDLRGLNYKHFNGVNTYTLLFLESLYAIKKQNLFHLTAVGLNPESYNNLTNKYPFTKELIDSSISTAQYLKIPTYFSNKICTVYLLCKFLFTQKLISKTVSKFDKLILVQPKILNFYPSASILTIFHDIYGVLGYNSTGFIQKIVENKPIFKAIAKNSKTIWGNSISTCNDLQDYLDVTDKQLQLVYPSLPTVPKKYSPNKLQKLYLAISGIEPRKNWYNLILAHHYNNLHCKDFDLELVLVGRVVSQAYYKKLNRLIQKHSIKNIRFQIDATEEQKNKLLASCQFTIYPSFWEGFGFPILESLAHNKPVITSKISSMPELAKDSGVYVNPLNPKEIAAAIQLLYTDKKYHQSLSQNCQKNLAFFDNSELTKRIQKYIIDS